MGLLHALRQLAPPRRDRKHGRQGAREREGAQSTAPLACFVRYGRIFWGGCCFHLRATCPETALRADDVPPLALGNPPGCEYARPWFSVTLLLCICTCHLCGPPPHALACSRRPSPRALLHLARRVGTRGWPRRAPRSAREQWRMCFFFPHNRCTGVGARRALDSVCSRVECARARRAPAPPESRVHCGAVGQACFGAAASVVLHGNATFHPGVFPLGTENSCASSAAPPSAPGGIKLWSSA